MGCDRVRFLARETSLVVLQTKKEFQRKCRKAIHAKHADDMARLIGHVHSREAGGTDFICQRVLVELFLEPSPKRIEYFECAADHVPRQSIRLASICVFRVHRLPSFALEFLLCDAADKWLWKYWRAGGAASAEPLVSRSFRPVKNHCAEILAPLSRRLANAGRMPPNQSRGKR
jgi:hypothetical protein